MSRELPLKWKPPRHGDQEPFCKLFVSHREGDVVVIGWQTHRGTSGVQLTPAEARWLAKNLDWTKT